MNYSIEFTPSFEKQLRKLKNKDKVLFERLTKKLKEIKDTPEHYKPLSNVLSGTRRAHLNPFIIVFEVKNNVVIIHYVKHHDDAY
ncbi:type II toxin-antitoxin system RelE/ParE family toxin [Candidatus Woesearchaeota archaeon]|nr:type II toxin-antitoxin system RelE/ParE family toxin [Candidatus Woesearchaeota archaeon]